ncbi:hypothetical protein DPEC_G00149770 [Dallia pectoralis]|uniref:Uncharacterized protein n=1 Tax=Dallia pectoralis TaxID=75939 RepID=A0ACC2GJB8_DALPE|nr:hypothetical protein DPEC_G00149770 [Dallia pectoralis]
MTYLVHTANPQFVGLWLSAVGWLLNAVTLGIIQWRIWQVSDLTFITSGVAWVGVWRVCFHSSALVTPSFQIMYCQSMSLSDPFVPPEVAAAQVLVPAALVVGFCGNAAAIYALRNVYFGLEKRTPIQCTFAVAGALCLLSASCFLVPLLWNLNSVVNNRTIAFPPNFHMPPEPSSQSTGEGIGVGLMGSFLMMVSGVIFISYRLPVNKRPCVDGSDARQMVGPIVRSLTDIEVGQGDIRAMDNPAFCSDERL